jgi:hypothetical protein
MLPQVLGINPKDKFLKVVIRFGMLELDWLVALSIVSFAKLRGYHFLVFEFRVVLVISCLFKVFI